MSADILQAVITALEKTKDDWKGRRVTFVHLLNAQSFPIFFLIKLNTFSVRHGNESEKWCLKLPIGKQILKKHP